MIIISVFVVLPESIEDHPKSFIILAGRGYALKLVAGDGGGVGEAIQGQELPDVSEPRSSGREGGVS